MSPPFSGVSSGSQMGISPLPTMPRHSVPSLRTPVRAIWLKPSATNSSSSYFRISTLPSRLTPFAERSWWTFAINVRAAATACSCFVGASTALVAAALAATLTVLVSFDIPKRGYAPNGGHIERGERYYPPLAKKNKKNFMEKNFGR